MRHSVQAVEGIATSNAMLGVRIKAGHTKMVKSCSRQSTAKKRKRKMQEASRAANRRR